MQRWLTRFVTIWLGLLVPSLVVWGLIVTWNEAGPGRFVRTWSWLADHLAFPLLLDPITHPASRWLTNDGGLNAAIGFVILLVVWCLMFALPLSIILSWANWFGGRLDPAGSATSGYSSPYALPAGSASPASNVLYFITIPLALAWHVLRIMLPISLITFVVIGIIRFGYTYVELFRHGSLGFSRRVADLDAAWHGHLGRVGMHHLFAGPWEAQYVPTAQLARRIDRDPFVFFQFDAHPEHFMFVIKVLALEAVMNALLIAVVIGLIAAVLEGLGSLRA